MKDATDKAVVIILCEKQNFTINSKILIIKHNFKLLHFGRIDDC